MGYGAAAGTAQGRTKRVDHATFRLYRTGGLKYGPTDDISAMDEIDTRDTDDDMDAAPPLITDDLRQAWPGGYETDGCMHLVSDTPVPATILAVIPEMETTQA
jgi:hypothetical protein